MPDGDVRRGPEVRPTWLLGAEGYGGVYARRLHGGDDARYCGYYR